MMEGTVWQPQDLEVTVTLTLYAVGGRSAESIHTSATMDMMKEQAPS